MFRTHPGEKNWFYCDACDETSYLQGSESPGNHDPDEEVYCKGCFKVLGHLRCDAGPPGIIWIRKGNHVGKVEMPA